MQILALDLATKTGWAHTCGESGVQTFALKRGETVGMRWIRFRAWLKEMLDTVPTELVVYEQAHHRGGPATHSAETLIGLVEVEVALRAIDITNYHTSTIKKHALPHSKKRDKVAMVTAAKRRWPDMEIIDDNHADALWLLDLATTELRENPRGKS